MDKSEVIRLIKHAKKLGVDPGLVLGWRMIAPPIRSYVSRPKGMLSMSDVKKKYRLNPNHLMKLRRDHGMPTTTKAHLVLVEETTLKEWLAKFPPNGRTSRPTC